MFRIKVSSTEGTRDPEGRQAPFGDQFRRVGTTWQTINTQPSWILRSVAIVFFLVILLPIFFLILLAFIAAFVLFAILAAVNRVLGIFRRPAEPLDDGRENVRVIKGDSPRF